MSLSRRHFQRQTVGQSETGKGGWALDMSSRLTALQPSADPFPPPAGDARGPSAEKTRVLESNSSLTPTRLGAEVTAAKLPPKNSKTFSRPVRTSGRSVRGDSRWICEDVPIRPIRPPLANPGAFGHVTQHHDQSMATFSTKQDLCLYIYYQKQENFAQIFVIPSLPRKRGRKKNLPRRETVTKGNLEQQSLNKMTIVRFIVVSTDDREMKG